MNKLQIISVKITGKPGIGNITKPDKRFNCGYRVIGKNPQISYTVDMVARPDVMGYIVLGDIIHTVLDTFQVFAVDNLNNKIYCRCVRINVKDDFNFNIETEVFYSVSARAVGEGSSHTRKL